MKLLSKLKTVLQKLDLPEKEIEFYCEVLRKPGCTVYEIARQKGFQKDVAYKLFESLTNNGLLTFRRNGNRREVIPASLKAFSQDVYARSCKLWKHAEQLRKMDKVIPMLAESKEIHDMEAFEADQFAEHWEDLAYWDWESVYAYGNFDMMIEKEKDVLNADYFFRDKRTKRGKFANPILTPGSYTDELVKTDEKELRKTQLLRVPHMGDDLVIILPDIDRVSIWTREKDGNISGIFVNNKAITRAHYNMHKYFQGISEAPSLCHGEPVSFPT